MTGFSWYTLVLFHVLILCLPPLVNQAFAVSIFRQSKNIPLLPIFIPHGCSTTFVSPCVHADYLLTIQSFIDSRSNYYPMLIYQESIIIIACMQNKFSINRQSRVHLVHYHKYTSYTKINQMNIFWFTCKYKKCFG